MKSIIQFEISLEDGVYTAGGVNAPIVTEGATFEAGLFSSWLIRAFRGRD